MFLTGAAEVRECSRNDDVCEGEQRRPLPWVIESHLRSVHVQYNPHDLQLPVRIERRPRGGTGFVLSIAQSNGPESFRRGQHVLSLPVDGRARHSDDPVGVVFDLHVPAVAAAAEAFIGQHLGAHVEALGVVWEIIGLRTAL